jgi:MFS transporter, DHA1 family, tetracycline resistance protein
MGNQKNAATIFIFITVLIDVIGIGIIIPVLPGLISGLKHCTNSEAAIYGGWLLFAYAIMSFLFAPVMGNLSDRYGRRPVLLLSLLGLALDYVLMAVAPTLGWLFLGRIIAGIMGSSYTVASAYIADVSTPEDRSKNYGMIGAAFGMGFIIGPPVGGLLEQFGSRAPFYAAAILTGLNFIYGYFVVPESLSKENRRSFDIRRANPLGAFKSLRRNPGVLGLAFAMFLVYMAGQSMPSVWNYVTIEKFQWSPKAVGLSLLVVGVLVAIVQGVLIRIINPRLGNKRSIYYGMLLWSAALFLFSIANSSTMMLLVCVPYCLGGIAGPAVQAVMSTKVAPSEQGELQGSMTAIMSVTLFLSPLLMTYLFSSFSAPTAPFYFPGAPFLVAGLFCLAGLFVAMSNLADKKVKS